ncbi:MAG TPA: LamG domain-containing protein [Chitinophagaceae bacterium]|nr:LamG domain-containing protein [Chitinophagaceae bacterium]
MKKLSLSIVTILIALCIYTTSCQKQVNYLPQIDSLKLSLSLLQLRFDSLSTALTTTNLNFGNLTVTVDSLKTQITLIIVQINQLNIQLTSTNVNVTSINSQISILTQQYKTLLAELNAILQQLTSLPSSLTNGLLAYYPFTGNANDSSGNGNNGTVQGAILATDRFGNLNSAYQFGTNENIIVTTPSQSLNLVGSFSISTWFYLDSLATSFNASMLLSKCYNEGNDGWTLGIWNPNHNFTSQIVNYQTNNQFNTNTYPGIAGIVSAQEWYNFVVTYNSQTQILQYFINGQLVSSISILFNTISNSRPITIGYEFDQFGTYNDYFRGEIDDIRIYNRVLSSQEVQYLAFH